MYMCHFLVSVNIIRHYLTKLKFYNKTSQRAGLVNNGRLVQTHVINYVPDCFTLLSGNVAFASKNHDTAMDIPKMYNYIWNTNITYTKHR